MATGDEAISGVVAALVAAWNQHDARAFSMAFAEDADFTNVRGMTAHGRRDIEQFHAPMFATLFKDSHLNITATKIRYLKPDVAAVDARWEMTGASGADGQAVPLRKGVLNFVMVQQAAQWRIAVMHNTELPS